MKTFVVIWQVITSSKSNINSAFENAYLALSRQDKNKALKSSQMQDGKQKLA